MDIIDNITDGLEMSSDTTETVLTKEEKKKKKSVAIQKRMQKAGEDTTQVGKTNIEVDINKLTDNPFQPRLTVDDDEIMELADTIKSKGLLHNIVITPKEDGTGYYIVVGHRRVAAHKLLNRTCIKADIRASINKQDLQALAFIENDQRLEMSRLEQALSIDLAITSNNYKNVSHFAAAIGRDQSTMSKIHKLLSLPEKIISDLKENKSTSDIKSLDAIRKISDEDIAIKLYFWFIGPEGSRVELLNKIKIMNKPQETMLLLEIKTSSKSTKIDIPKKLDEDQIEKLKDFIEKFLL
ncbi:MAG: hypothetical protein COB67_00135 [SAR324 cluster bacterium]|uniref:ParB-like N-terminal domain-containing protein n=1 Tax=SAR324 cluster bacterium TaxID=2024889 RepID=A0A2A4TD62_9DELT|nr:MAG: hypothetical protein COB67_00135 [SAR324 cluster bacterium]